MEYTGCVHPHPSAHMSPSAAFLARDTLLVQSRDYFSVTFDGNYNSRPPSAANSAQGHSRPSSGRMGRRTSSGRSAVHAEADGPNSAKSTKIGNRHEHHVAPLEKKSRLGEPTRPIDQLGVAVRVLALKYALYVCSSE